MIKEGRVLTSAVMLALFAGMAGYALTFPPKARFLPLVIGIPGLVLCIAQMLLEHRSHKHEEREPGEVRREFVMFGWFGLFIVAILIFGFAYAGPVLVGAYLHFDWRERPLVSIGAGLVTFAVLYGVFEWALELRLYGGLLDGWLPG